MSFSLQDKPCSNQMADSWFPTAVISHFYSAVYVVSENEAIYKVFGLVHFSWNELWRVAIDIVLIINSSLHHVNRLSINSNAVFVFVITSLNALSHVECH